MALLIVTLEPFIKWVSIHNCYNYCLSRLSHYWKSGIIIRGL